MNKITIYICFAFLLSACNSNPIDSPSEVEHLVLNEVLKYLPFDQFNEYSKAIFKDPEGNLFAFNLTINEDVKENLLGENPYSSNQITFGYRTEFNIEVDEMEVIARIDNLPELGPTEMVICGIGSLSSSFSRGKLTIIPGLSYKNTILNDEFFWMGETFKNVYSNNIIEEENFVKKIFYQPDIGIIGFTDRTDHSWLFIRYE